MPPTAHAAVSKGDPKDCDDFRTQNRAQRWFRKHHPRQDPAGLDADNGRTVCEDNPCPCSRRWHQQHDRSVAAPDRQARRAANVKVLCRNKDYPEPVGNGNGQIRKKPPKCKFIKRGEVAEFAAVEVKSLSWKGWGNRKAVGSGNNCSPMAGTCTRVKVRLSMVRERCGRRVYSTVKFRFPKFNNTAGFKLWTC
jgi:hypothetical protein